MSKDFKFVCDGCEVTARAEPNGEHLLPPTEWRQLFHPHASKVLPEHLCGACTNRILNQPRELKDKEPRGLRHG